MSDFTIRPGRLEDEEAFSKAMRDSGPAFAAVWGERHDALVRHLFRRPGTLYSADLTRAAEISGTVVSVLLTWSGAEALRRADATRRAIRDFLGWRYYVRVPRLAVMHRALHGPEPDELYFANIGVDARRAARLPVPREVRLHGIGPTMIDFGVEEGRRAGLRRAFADVRENNSPALQMFRRSGFSEAGRSAPFLLGSERFVFVQMARPLAEETAG